MYVCTVSAYISVWVWVRACMCVCGWVGVWGWGWGCVRAIGTNTFVSHLHGVLFIAGRIPATLVHLSSSCTTASHSRRSQKG